MNTLEFLSYLRQLDIELEADGERLRITAPAKALTAALRNQLREHKADLLLFLQEADGLVMPRLPHENGLPPAIGATSVGKKQRAGLLTDVTVLEASLPSKLAEAALPSDESALLTRGEKLALDLNPELIQKLRRLSQEAGTGVLITLLAGFNALLYRYTQAGEGSEQEKILVTWRHQGQTEGLRGSLPLILQSKVEERLSFSDLLKQVAQHLLHTHQSTLTPGPSALTPPSPAPLLGGVGGGGRGALSAPSLAPISPPTLGGKGGAGSWGVRGIMLKIWEEESRLIGYFEYDNALFERDTIQRMNVHLINLLKGAVANPQQAISKLPLLSSEEQYQLLVEWNQRELNYRRDATIHDYFEESVKEVPDKKAISVGTKSLTYEELNQRGNQLAHYLQRLGIGPEIVVGICMERSVDMVIAILGILKAGAAYLVLEPRHPQERLSFMIEDAQLSFLLMQEALLELIPGSHSSGQLLYSSSGKRYLAPLVICIDRDWAEIAATTKAATAKSSHAITRVSARHLACVSYTSHWTGKPKGVLIEHQALVHRSTAMANLYDLKRDDRVLSFADDALPDLFASWLSGATVMLRGEFSPDRIWGERGGESKQLTEWITKEEVTVLNLPATEWHSFDHYLLSSQQALPASLRLMVIGDEAALPSEELGRVSDWQATSGSNKVRCLNTFGYVESGMINMVYEGQPQAEIATTKAAKVATPLYILDKLLQPVPIGVIGELYIAGEGLARGYLRESSLTNERLISNPFEMGRLYKSGDFARYLPDGKIERVRGQNRQVNIRGVRIDLGEVEARLLEHPMVRDGVVIARQSKKQPRSKELVAYFSPNQGSLPSPKQWKTFFSQKLPSLMVPAIVTPLDIPRLANGKVDYQSLATRDNHDYLIVPRTAIQHKLVEIWQEVLPCDVEEIGIHEDFFAVGGNYFLATQVLSRLQESCQVDFSLRNLFEAPTIAELAEQIETVQWATQTVALDLPMDNREQFDLA